MKATPLVRVHAPLQLNRRGSILNRLSLYSSIWDASVGLIIGVWTTLSSFRTAVTYRHNRGMSLTASHTICTHEGSHAALPSSRIFRRDL